MSNGALNSTHTIVVKSENRGIRVVIGGLAVFLLTLWWWTGSLAAVVAFFVPAAARVEAGEFGSVTGELLKIAIDLLWFAGSSVITVLSLGKVALVDIVSGIFETFGYYSARRKAEGKAKQAAIEAAQEAAGINAGVIATTIGVSATVEQASEAVLALDPKKVSRVIDEHDNTLAEIDRRLLELEQRNTEQMREIVMESLTGPIVTLERQIDDHESTLKIDYEKFAAFDKALSSLNERLTAFEAKSTEATGPSAEAATSSNTPARRKSTRQVAAKRR